jgi:hypothetical protein
MASHDMWCPNCKQLVKPTKARPGWLDMASTIVTLYCLAQLGAYFGILPWVASNSIEAGLAIGVLGGLLGKITNQGLPSQCPICKTERIEAPAPVFETKPIALACPNCDHGMAVQLETVPNAGIISCPSCGTHFTIDPDAYSPEPI